MSGNLFAAIIGGFFVLVIVAVLYSALIGQPRLRRQLKEESEKRGWTYTPGKSLIVAKSANGHLLSPQETISDSIQGSDQGINWRVDGVTVMGKVSKQVVRTSGEIENNGPRSIYQVIWHSEDVRIEHGSVLLFLKPEGWTHNQGAGGMVKAGLQSVYLKLIYDLMRENFGIQNTPVQLDSPEFDAKYRIEVSDFGAAQVALTAAVREFLIKQRPPAILIQLGDNALDIIAEDSTYLKKIERFGKLAALAEYGVQLALVVSASQSAASPLKNSDATDQ